MKKLIRTIFLVSICSSPSFTVCTIFLVSMCSSPSFTFWLNFPLRKHFTIRNHLRSHYLSFSDKLLSYQNIIKELVGFFRGLPPLLFVRASTWSLLFDMTPLWFFKSSSSCKTLSLTNRKEKYFRN